MDSHTGAECVGCGWEGHKQPFRWFPELGAPLEIERSPQPLPAGGPTFVEASTDSDRNRARHL